MKDLVINCVVACHNASGEPDFFFCRIGCMQEQYDEGEHYEAARCQAQLQGYEGDFVVYDENDGPNWLFEHCVWESAGTVEVDDLA